MKRILYFYCTTKQDKVQTVTWAEATTLYANTSALCKHPHKTHRTLWNCNKVQTTFYSRPGKPHKALAAKTKMNFYHNYGMKMVEEGKEQSSPHYL